MTDQLPDQTTPTGSPASVSASNPLTPPGLFGRPVAPNPPSTSSRSSTSGPSGPSGPPSSYLVLGGSGSGKSDFAQQLAARAGASVTYLATGKAEGPEMEWRIRKHRTSRPSHWRTVEAPRDLARALELAADSAPVVLLEDVGSLTANCLPWVDEKDGQQAEPGADLAAAVDALTVELDAVFEWCTRQGKSLVVVSSEVGMGFLPSSPVSRLYKDAIGDINQTFAARVDAAYLVVAGLPIDLTTGARAVRSSLGIVSI